MYQPTENVYVETAFQGSNNTFVVTSEGIVMIDTPQMPGDAMKWRQEIEKHGKVKYIINSEPHGDHISGNFFFGGTVVGHDGVRDAALNSSVEDLREMMKATDPLPDDFRFVPPAITFSQKMTLHLGEHTFELTNLPGHSPYQAAVYIPEEKVVCTSDNVVNGVQPFLHQSLPYDWLESLKRYQEMDADFVVPGHGRVGDKSIIPQMSKSIQAWIDTVKEALEKGMSPEEAEKDTALFARHGITLSDDPMSRRGAGISLARLFEVLK